MSRFDLVVRGGRLVLPREGVIEAALAVSGGRIAAVADPDAELPADREIDATGLHVFPGVIDAHTHIGIGAGYGDFDTESRAAALGGVTTVFLFLREPVAYGPLFARALAEGESRSVIDFGFHAVVLTEQHLRELRDYVERLGIRSFKFYMTYRGEDAQMRTFDLESVPFAGIDDGFMLDFLRTLAGLPDAIAIVHCENIELIQRLRRRLREQGGDGLADWNASRPPLAEVEAVRRALLFAESSGARLHVLHLTTAAALREVTEFRRRYGRVSVEVCHPYLVPEPDLGDRRWKVRPPTRSREDVEALWTGIGGGGVDTIGSDHVPRPLADKLGEIWSAVTGLGETPRLLPMLLDEGHHARGLPLPRIADLVARRPAELVGLYPRKGSLAVGADADLCLVDLDAELLVRASDSPSRCDYSVYEGRRFRGRPVATIVRGEIVMDEGRVLAPAGWGRYVGRNEALALRAGATA